MTLELGGKSPNLVLDDADFVTAIPLAVTAMASRTAARACLGRGTRILVPEHRLDEAIALAQAAVGGGQGRRPARSSD